MVKVKNRPKKRTHNREMIHKPSILKATQKSGSGSELITVKRQSSRAKLKRLMTGMKKKEKMAVKKSYLHRKIKKIKNAQMEAVEKKKKEKQLQPVVHDMKPLLEALPTDEEMTPLMDLIPKGIPLLKDKPEEGSQDSPLLEAPITEAKLKRLVDPQRPSSTYTTKEREHQFMDDLNTFKVVQDQPKYKRDPLGTIRSHIAGIVGMQEKVAARQKK